MAGIVSLESASIVFAADFVNFRSFWRQDRTFLKIIGSKREFREVRLLTQPSVLKLRLNVRLIRRRRDRLTIYDLIHFGHVLCNL